MKPYFICAFDSVVDANRYFKSFDEHIDGNLIVLMYELNGDVKDLRIPDGAIIIRAGKKYTGNTGRHLDLKRAFEKLQVNKEAWFFFTDVHDVVFQTKLPKIPKDVDILVSTEGRTFGEIDFWKERYPKNVMHLQAYNAGCFAMRYDVLMKFWEELEQEWMKFYTWYKTDSTLTNVFPFSDINIQDLLAEFKKQSALVFNGYVDTLFFNKFIRKYKFTDVEGLFGCYAFGYELGMIKIVNDLSYTDRDKLISIVHYNGSTKKYIKNK